MATTAPQSPMRTRKGRPARAGGGSQAPKLADGIELIGEFEGSGFKESPYLARRGDGQVIQLSKLLYSVAANADGKRDCGQVAERVSEEVGRGVSRDNVRFLVEKKLRPVGVLAAADGSSPELKKADPVLALKFRAALIPERAVRGITTILRPLFLPPVVVAVLAGLATLDVWLFLLHGVAQSTRALVYQPILLLMVLGMVVLSAAFHECGHATACRYGGAKPGVMGAGIYVVWPAFYTDVTDAYRLDKAGRLRTDLGGVYFNVIFSLATAGLYFATGFEPLLVVVVLQHLEILHQFLPFLRLDGYYIISDLTGVPDMFSRIGPTLRSLIPGREPHARVKELKPWVRVATSVYVIALVPTLLTVFVLMLVSAPRVLATAYDSFLIQIDKVGDALSGGKAIAGVAGLVQVLALALPVAGLALTAGRGSRRLGLAAWTQTEDRPAARAALVSTVAAGLALAAFTLWPNGEYRPIQPGEEGTLQGGLERVSHIPSGRPALSPERARELGGATFFSRTGDDPLAPASASGSRGDRATGPGPWPKGGGETPRGGDKRRGTGEGESRTSSSSDSRPDSEGEGGGDPDRGGSDRGGHGGDGGGRRGDPGDNAPGGAGEGSSTPSGPSSAPSPAGGGGRASAP